MSGPLALFGSLRNAWPLYLAMLLALMAGSIMYVVALNPEQPLMPLSIVLIWVALSFAVPDLWTLYPALTMLPSYVISTLGLDDSTHNLFGIEIILYAVMALLGLLGSSSGRSLRQRLTTRPIYKYDPFHVRAAKSIGGAVLIVGILSWSVGSILGFIPDSKINALKQLIKKGDTATVLGILSTTDTSPNSRSQGWTMLMHAVRSGNSAMVKVLLERGADPNGKGTGGATALTIAAEDGSTDIGRLLLQYQANVNATNAKGTTALMYAVENCHKDFVDTLVRAGADLTLHDDDGESAIMIARRRDHTDIVSMLIMAGAKDEKPLSFSDKKLTQSLCKLDSGSRHP